VGAGNAGYRTRTTRDASRAESDLCVVNRGSGLFSFFRSRSCVWGLLGGLRPEAYYMQIETVPAGVDHP
jgi:hypothetical protein